jgi:hypothetical protein
MTFILGHNLSPGNIGVSIVVPGVLNAQSMSLLGHDYVLDTNRRTLSIDWEISGFVEHSRLSHHLDDTFEHYLFNQAVDVYFYDTSNKVFSYDPNKIPTDQTHRPAYVQELTSFRTVHKLHPSAHAIDSYTFNLLAFAIAPATGTPVNITQFRLENLLDWFAIFSNGTRGTTGFTHHTTNGSITTEVESHVLAVEIRRSEWARTFNMCIFATNWILTVGAVHFLWERTSGWVAVIAAILRISGVLAIATIRNLYIGTPPFGPSLNVVEFFLQITIIALSSMAWLYDSRVGCNISQHREGVTSDRQETHVQSFLNYASSLSFRKKGYKDSLARS